MILQEFDLEIRDKKGVEILVVDHLSTLYIEKASLEGESIDDCLRDDYLYGMSSKVQWYIYIALAMKGVPLTYFSKYERQKLLKEKTQLLLGSTIPLSI